MLTPEPTTVPVPAEPASDRQRRLVRTALASALALGLGVTPALAHKGKPNEEVCYGIAKAGENKCSNLLGTHECAGEATEDNAIDEWTYVPKGSCKRLKGFTKAEAERKLKQQLAAAAATAPAPAPPPAPARAAVGAAAGGTAPAAVPVAASGAAPAASAAPRTPPQR